MLREWTIATEPPGTGSQFAPYRHKYTHTDRYRRDKQAMWHKHF